MYSIVLKLVMSSPHHPHCQGVGDRIVYVMGQRRVEEMKGATEEKLFEIGLI